MSEDMLSAEAAANAVTSAQAGTPSDAGIANAIARADVDPDSFPRDVIMAFRAAARRLDAAEKELLAARTATAEAVGRLREEAVK